MQVYVQKFDPTYRMIVFDMDGVLVDIKSSWQFIHEAFGADNRKNLERYVEGQMTYQELMRRDIALWGRVRIDEISRILSNVSLMPGATETFAVLREEGLRTSLISAGVSVLADRLKAILGIDRVFANKVLIDRRGFLTGEGEERVSLLDKLGVFRKLAALEKVSLRECVVVGDSLYDIPMFEETGLSIAFNADDNNVRRAADVAIEKKDLREMLPFLMEQSE